MTDVADLVGIPYKAHGRDERGLDCFGLVLLIARRNGTPVEDVWYRGFDPALVKLAERMNVKKTDACVPGCIVEMENEGRLHLGYALENGMMIHATVNEGVVAENIGAYPVKGYWELAG